MKLRLPPRDQDGHKGTFGTVSVFGGSCTGAVRMIGAPALVALGALRSGCGLVRVYAPEPILNHVLAIVPSATGRALKVDARGRIVAKVAAEAAREACAASHAVVIGPGMGDAPGVLACVKAAVGACAERGDEAPPLVLDADALNALASSGGRASLRSMPSRVIVTPHPGEFARLYAALDLPKRPAPGNALHAGAAAGALSALIASLKSECTWVLKGRQTCVARGGEAHFNSSGNAALGTGGTGDVLAGVIGGLVAQFASGARRPHAISLYELACIGVHVHGLAAEAWAAARGASAGLLAAELTEFLPGAVESVRERARVATRRPGREDATRR